MEGINLALDEEKSEICSSNIKSHFQFIEIRNKIPQINMDASQIVDLWVNSHYGLS